MENKCLQTVLVGCAWCKKIVDIQSHESKCEGDCDCSEKLAILSHGICQTCGKAFEMPAEEEK